MAVDAELAGAVAARRVVAREPGVVVGACLGADRGFELGDDGEGGEGFGARWGGADDAGGGTAVGGGEQAFEGEGGLAGTAAERQARGVLETDGVGDLGFEGEDVVLRVGAGGGGGGDGVFARVEAEAFGEADSVGAVDWGAEPLDGREDLLVEVPFDVRFEARLGPEHVLWRVGALGGGLGSGFRVASYDVRHYVVDAWVFTLGDFAQGDLDLGHAFGVGVVLGVLAQFLEVVSGKVEKRGYGGLLCR